MAKSSLRSCKTTEHNILLNIPVFCYMTLCHQVSTFPRIVLLSSSESGSWSVHFVTMLGRIKEHSSLPKHQDLPVRHSVTSHRIGSFIHIAVLTLNLASHLAFTSCYQYYVTTNMIIQSICVCVCVCVYTTRADWSYGMLAIIRCRMCCLPGCYPKT
jgi:hypothetical protein